MTTAMLWNNADEAEARSDFLGALSCVAEIVRVSPDELRARTRLGTLLHRLGHLDLSQEAFVNAAQYMVSKGEAFWAIVALHDALLAKPDSALVKNALGQLYDRILKSRHVARTASLPPAPPQPVEETDLESLLWIANPQELIARTTELIERQTTDWEVAAPCVPPPFFASLDRESYLLVVAQMEHRKVDAGATILREGEIGDTLYIVVYGDAEVVTDREVPRRRIAMLGRGAVFGEMSLVVEQPRAATVIAATPLELIAIRRSLVEDVAKTHPAITQQIVDFAKGRMLKNVLDTSPLFLRLEAHDRATILRSFSPRVVVPGTELVREGEPSSGLFVIASGEVAVKATDAAHDTLPVATLRSGDVFGEISLFSGGSATASVVARQKTVVLHLPRAKFLEFVETRPSVRAYLKELSADRIAETRRVVDQAREVVDADDLVIV